MTVLRVCRWVWRSVQTLGLLYQDHMKFFGWIFTYRKTCYHSLISLEYQLRFTNHFISGFYGTDVASTGALKLIVVFQIRIWLLYIIYQVVFLEYRNKTIFSSCILLYLWAVFFFFINNLSIITYERLIIVRRKCKSLAQSSFFSELSYITIGNQVEKRNLAFLWPLRTYLMVESFW